MLALRKDGVSCRDRHGSTHGGFPKMGGPEKGGFIRENPIKMDDLEVAPFYETSIWVLVLVITTIWDLSRTKLHTLWMQTR